MNIIREPEKLQMVWCTSQILKLKWKVHMRRMKKRGGGKEEEMHHQMEVDVRKVEDGNNEINLFNVHQSIDLNINLL